MSSNGVPARSDYGHGCYRRCIDLEASPGTVRGELADDFHHVAVGLQHDGRVAREIRGEAQRLPWTTCSGALEPLRRMEGANLSLPLFELLRHTPAREQCTHLHDLACLAIAHAWRASNSGEIRRRYDVAMPDRVDRRTRCTLARDGEELLAWEIEGLTIVAADDPALEGLRIGESAFRERLASQPDRDAIEAAWILQRAVFIGLGRQHDFDQMPTAEAFARHVGGSCHTYAAHRMADGKRIHGTVRDFTERPEDVLGR